jgi:hypothetical protein
MREWLDFDASSSTANPRNGTVPIEGQEPSSEVRLDRLRNYATYYKAKRQDEQIKRKQARDAAAGLLQKLPRLMQHQLTRTDPIVITQHASLIQSQTQG